MRLLQIGASWFSYQLSGLERYYAELVARLPSLGNEVTGLVYELREPPQIDGLKLVSLGTQRKSVVRQYFDQQRIVEKHLNNGVDLVVSHCTPSLFPSLKHLGDKPLVCHFHGPRYLERSVEGANPLSVRLSKFIEKKVYARTQHAIVLSRYMKNVLSEFYGFPAEKVSVIPGGVDLDKFRQLITRREARKNLGLPLDRIMVVTVRRLEPRMGLFNLLEAVGEVAGDFPEILLLIAGKGSLRQDLDETIRRKSLSAHVRMLGAVSDDDLPLLYKAADFSIVPTVQYEGFGLILIESLAAGTPALGTPLGAIPEVLGPLSTALLLQGAESPLLAEGMREVLAGKRRLPSAAECERYAMENFSWPFVAAKVNDVYRSVLNAEPGKNRV